MVLDRLEGVFSMSNAHDDPALLGRRGYGEIAGEGFDVRAQRMVSDGFYTLGDIPETSPAVVSYSTGFSVHNLSRIANVDRGVSCGQKVVIGFDSPNLSSEYID